MKQPPRDSIERIKKMAFAKVYPLYLQKVEKKGRTKQDLDTVITWLTGYCQDEINTLVRDEVTFTTFFDQCTLNVNAHLIKGVVCGYRVENVEDALMRQVKYLDKLVDELAKGKKIESILRTK